MTSSFDLNFYSEGGSIRRGELQRLTGTREDAGPGDHQCDVFRRTHLCAAAREFLLLLSEQFERCEIRIQRTAHHRFIIDVLENVMSGIGTNRFSKIFRQCTPRPAVRRNTIIAALSEEEVRDVVENSSACSAASLQSSDSGALASSQSRCMEAMPSSSSIRKTVLWSVKSAGPCGWVSLAAGNCSIAQLSKIYWRTFWNTGPTSSLSSGKAFSGRAEARF